MKKVPMIGIITGVLYFVLVVLFLITKTEAALTIWELFTIIGAIVILIALLELTRLLNIPSIYMNAMMVFMSCTCLLTEIAHIVNIKVTRKLARDGINDPNYLRIGYRSSVERALIIWHGNSLQGRPFSALVFLLTV